MEIIAEFKTTIIPDRVVYNGIVKKLLKVDDKFKIRGYKLYLTENDELTKLVIDTPHPNCNPKTGEFCISLNIKGREVNNLTIPVIESLLKTFNLDDCFYQPWRDIYF